MFKVNKRREPNYEGFALGGIKLEGRARVS
jgi:hypothetical protein